MTVEISDLLPETPLDFVMISQVLTNLLDNAVRAYCTALSQCPSG